MNWSFRANLLILLMFVYKASANEFNSPENLLELRWQHRIIIVHTNDALSTTVIDQLKYFNAEVQDRDITWFVVSGQQLYSNATFPLNQSLLNNVKDYDYRENLDDLSAVLIGKDGGVKSRQQQWNIDQFFALIDTMPMRKREMRDNQ